VIGQRADSHVTRKVVTKSHHCCRCQFEESVLDAPSSDRGYVRESIVVDCDPIASKGIVDERTSPSQRHKDVVLVDARCANDLALPWYWRVNGCVDPKTRSSCGVDCVLMK
jgi:hypothetical protein